MIKAAKAVRTANVKGNQLYLFVLCEQEALCHTGRQKQFPEKHLLIIIASEII